MASPQIPLDAFRGDMNATFRGTYERQIGASKELPGLMRLGVPSDKRQEYYGYPESPPTIDYWQRGKAIPRETAKIVTYSVVNENWGKAFEFNIDDLTDQTLVPATQWSAGLGKRAAQLPEEIAFQIVDGTTDNRLLPVVPTAPDGAALFSATDGGGAARFGVTGGNILSGNGYGSGQVIRADFLRSVSRAKAFLDTKGQPLHVPSDLQNGILVVASSDYEEAFREAFVQGRTLQVDGAGGGAGAVTNIIMDAGYGITVWLTPRKAAESWLVVFTQAGESPLFQQTREAPRVIEANESNSDWARNTRQFSFQLDMRAGFGVNLPLNAIEIDNS